MNRKKIWIGSIYALCFFVMILDAQTAIQGAKDGVVLCLYTVIPALFPFILLSILLNSYLMGSKIGFIQPLTKLCGIPAGCETILIPAFLGGYPVGAQAIYDAWQSGKLDKQSAKQMLGFCNNAGPAFIFGITSGMFSKPYIPLVLWLIHILSAFLTGILLPHNSLPVGRTNSVSPVTFRSALKTSCSTMVEICSWIVVFRVILAFFDHWILCSLPENTVILIKGLLELTNGCISADSLNIAGKRFVYIAVFLGFGGLCVTGQTMSVTKQLGTGYYFPGKIMQSCISYLMAYWVQFKIFPVDERIKCPAFITMVMLAVPFFLTILFHSKKIVAIWNRIIYNRQKSIV